MITYLITGEQGSGKSCLAHVISQGKDPVLETTEERLGVDLRKKGTFEVVVVENVHFKSTELKKLVISTLTTRILVLITNKPVPEDLQIYNLRRIHIS